MIPASGSGSSTASSCRRQPISPMRSPSPYRLPSPSTSDIWRSRRRCRSWAACRPQGRNRRRIHPGSQTRERLRPIGNPGESRICRHATAWHRDDLHHLCRVLGAGDGARNNAAGCAPVALSLRRSVGRRLRFLSQERPDAGAADAVVFRDLHPDTERPLDLARKPQCRGDLRGDRARALPGSLFQRGPSFGRALGRPRPDGGSPRSRPRLCLGDAVRDHAAGRAQRAAATHQSQRLAVQEQ
ncbi:hypothetical protein RHECNPAF_1360078 [Rhizobium etli CNPAF512]|nr:hypothetical protein RHECNPAF_1360078 [Rhizobium etli CNPAF512]